MLSCLLLWLRHSSRQLQCPATSFVQSYSFHFISLLSLSLAHVHSVWVMIFPTIRAHNHKLHSLPWQGSFHSITLHYALFHSAGRSTPAAIAVLACAVVRAAGCHVFCTTHCCPTRDQLLSTISTPRQKITPALVRCVPLPGHMLSLLALPHSSHRTHSFLFRAPCSHPSSCSRTHFGEAPSFALAARNYNRGLRTPQYRVKFKLIEL